MRRSHTGPGFVDDKHDGLRVDAQDATQTGHRAAQFADQLRGAVLGEQPHHDPGFLGTDGRGHGAVGRYIPGRDQHPAPIDPNFTGVGRTITIKPAPNPGKNHHNAWRPAHNHFSLFGTDFTQRDRPAVLSGGDPLFSLDPIYQAITEVKARERLMATYEHHVTTHEWSTGDTWDIVLTGSNRTWMEEAEGEH